MRRLRVLFASFYTREQDVKRCESRSANAAFATWRRVGVAVGF